MEQIRRIYDEVSTFYPFQWKVDTRAVENRILEKIAAALGMETPIQDEPKAKTLTKEEEYLLGAKKVYPLDLQEGVILSPQKSYIYGYQDLSYDEFCSYIFWRTLIRNKKTDEVPNGFLALYLIEIVNFVEVDSYKAGMELISYLGNLCKDMPKNQKQLSQAAKEFCLLYGSEVDANNYLDLSEFDYIYEDKRILNGCHSNLLVCLSQRKYSAFLKSKMYLENQEYLEKNFPEYFYSMMDYFEEKGVHLLDILLGKLKSYSMEMTYVKCGVQEAYIEKSVVREGVTLIRVRGEKIKTVTKYFTDGTQANKAHLFVDSYVVKYILRLYERRMRALLGYPKITPVLKDLAESGYRSNITERIVDVFSSFEFIDRFH